MHTRGIPMPPGNVNQKNENFGIKATRAPGLSGMPHPLRTGRASHMLADACPSTDEGTRGRPAYPTHSWTCLGVCMCDMWYPLTGVPDTPTFSFRALSSARPTQVEV